MFAQDIKDLGELLKLLMALIIELAINFDLFKPLLILGFKEELKFLENDLSSHELAMLLIMSLHFGSVLADFSDAFIVSGSQIIKLRKQVISFIEELVHNSLQILLFGCLVHFLQLPLLNCVT
jgi:hypothetical protein